jgi:hypothetical protein
MHQVGTQFWHKTRYIPRSLALLTLAMASNSSIKQSEELKFYSMDIVCVAHGCPEILSTSNTPMTSCFGATFVCPCWHILPAGKFPTITSLMQPSITWGQFNAWNKGSTFQFYQWSNLLSFKRQLDDLAPSIWACSKEWRSSVLPCFI